MIIYFTSNPKIWLLSMLIPFLLQDLQAGGAAEISDPNSIIKNELIVYFTSNSKIWLVSVLNLWSK